MNYFSDAYADKLWKAIKKKHGQSRKKFMSVEAKEDYNQTVKILEALCEIILK